MEKNLKKKKRSITISILIMFAGVCFLSSTYFQTKKHELFEDMNELYYEQIVNIDTDLEELNNEVTDIEEDKTEVKEETTEVTEDKVVENTTKPSTTTKKVLTSSEKYYIGYLTIKKIDLKKGFTKIDSSYNNVNRNIFVAKSSTFPGTENHNLIIASHSGSSAISFFKKLYLLSKGDVINITYGNKEYEYKIVNIYTDPKDGTVSIRRNKNKNTVTLITCTKGDSKTQTVYIAELI